MSAPNHTSKFPVTDFGTHDWSHATKSANAAARHTKTAISLFVIGLPILLTNGQHDIHAPQEYRERSRAGKTPTGTRTKDLPLNTGVVDAYKSEARDEGTFVVTVIGIMTGNSLDAADLVATRFDDNGDQADLATHTSPLPAALKEELTWVRSVVSDRRGDTSQVASLRNESLKTTVAEVSDRYVRFIAHAVQELVAKVSKLHPGTQIDLLGFHGQTCAHMPPSIAKSKDPSAVYTVQLGNGQQLADLTGITVVYDFRSDDIMNLGEGAPLAPIHHAHLAAQTRKRGHFPIAFCNAGNTGNITIITEERTSGALEVRGWDTGPFNNFPDKLAQREKGLACDVDGTFGERGSVDLSLLGALFHTSALTKEGENFLLRPPPRSSDPEWYTIIPQLTDQAIPFETRIRTAEYFSAYIFFHTLSFIPPELRMPKHFAVCGGGWRNPVPLAHFQGLLSGDFANNPVLPEHSALFSEILARLRSDASGSPSCRPSGEYGFDGTAMEARIFADAAVCRLKGEPFSLPSTTGVSRPTVAGLIRYPKSDRTNASHAVRSMIDSHSSVDLTSDLPGASDPCWNRATAGWSKGAAES